MELISRLSALRQLRLPDRIHQTFLLITSYSSALLQEDEKAAEHRMQLQASLCHALLQSLQPTLTAKSVVPQRFVTAAATHLSTAGAGAAPPSTHAQQDTHDKQDTLKPDVELRTALNPTAAASTGYPQSDFVGSATAPDSRSACVLLAEAWHAAGPALGVIYKWENDEVVRDVIAFWGSVCDLLLGAWLQQFSSTTPSNCPASTTACAYNIPRDSGNLPQQHLQQLHYIQWLFQCGKGTLSAVVSHLHDFHSLTGISSLQHKQRTPAMHLLLLFLQISNGRPSSSNRDSSAAAASIPARQLLHLAQWPALQRSSFSITDACPNNTRGVYIAAAVGEALKPHEAFVAALKLLQAGRSGPVRAEGAAAAAAGGESGRNSGSSDTPPWQQLATAVGQFLRAAYALGSTGAANSAAMAGAGDPCSRYSDTPYDLCMMELFSAMLEGPWSSASRSCRLSFSAAAAGGCLGANAPSQSAGLCAKSKHTKRQHNEQDRRWEQWSSSDGFRALAELVAGYDKPQQLVRGLVALAMHQLQQQQEQGRIRGQSAVSAGSLTEKDVISRVMLLLQCTYLQQQDAGHGSSSSSGCQQAVDPTKVRGLLLGCAELLRPAANCSVDWRCAALELMTFAVEQFAAAHPDDGVLHTKLWCSSSLEGLCYCLNHDTSIRARRLAMKLLQMVALPAGSPAALQLLQTLATKTCDKDGHVAVSALGLLVQLDASVLCSSITAQQFSGVVQVGLQQCRAAPAASSRNACAAAAAAAMTPVEPMEVDAGIQDNAEGAVQLKSGLCGSKEACGRTSPASTAIGGGKTPSKDVCLPSATKQRFVNLLCSVILCDEEAVQRAQQQVQNQGLRPWLVANAGKVVGVGGCRLLLLLLLQDSKLAAACDALSQQLPVVS